MGAPPPAPPSLAERFWDVFAAPRRAMDAVAVRPAWAIPFVVLMLLMVLYTMANVHILIPEQSEMALEHVSGEAAVGLEQQIEMFSDPPMWLRVVAGLGAGLTVVVFSILLPGVILHLFLKLSGGRGQVGQTLGVLFWAALIPYGLRTLLGWIVVVASGSGKLAGLTAASLMPNPNPQSLGYVIANLYGDPFMYWMLAVSILGLAIGHKIDLARSAIVTVATFVLLSTIPIGFTLVGQVVAGA
jgi:hypothetical protein